MTVPPRARVWLIRAALVAAGLMAGFLVLELGVRLLTAASRPSGVETGAAGGNQPTIPLVVACDCPWVIELNRDHPEVNSLGLRGSEIDLDQPTDAQRVLILGDSIAYGVFVPAEMTFASLLAQQLNRAGDPVQLLNVSVPSWTPYNEVQSYLGRWRAANPDLVLVVLSLNDVVNPRRHWPQPAGHYYWEDLPADAIPNPVYDQELIARFQRETRPSLWQRSALYRLVTKQIRAAVKSVRFQRWVDGRFWPIFLTGEDTIAVDVWLDYQSPEWQWLRAVYDDLRQALAEDGTRLAIAIVPLAYQMDPAYPYHPQEQILRYCAETETPCLDLLPALRAQGGQENFMGDTGGMLDVWHLSPQGHQVVADEIARFLEQADLLTPAP